MVELPLKNALQLSEILTLVVERKSAVVSFGMTLRIQSRCSLIQMNPLAWEVVVPTGAGFMRSAFAWFGWTLLNTTE